MWLVAILFRAGSFRVFGATEQGTILTADSMVRPGERRSDARAPCRLIQGPTTRARWGAEGAHAARMTSSQASARTAPACRRRGCWQRRRHAVAPSSLCHGSRRAVLAVVGAPWMLGGAVWTARRRASMGIGGHRWAVGGGRRAGRAGQRRARDHSIAGRRNCHACLFWGVGCRGRGSHRRWPVACGLAPGALQALLARNATHRRPGAQTPDPQHCSTAPGI